VWDGTGLIVTAMETKRLGVHFAPSLGAAPAWCHFLENITEEMEEEAAPSRVRRLQVRDEGRAHTTRDG
jgi:ribosome biogenesis protein ENP2